MAGPYCGKLLAALGAEVIKVESPPFGDPSRLTGPFLPNGDHPEKSALFLHNNTGKKSVLLDWSTNQGFKSLKRLIADADVLIEDWDLSTRRTKGVDTNTFVSFNSQLIEVSITPFGLSGPYSKWKSSPIVQMAMGAIMNIIGIPDREPLMIPGYQPDYLAGTNACNSVAIALWERDHSGQGNFLEITMLETLANLHQAPLDMEGGIRHRNGHRQSALSTRGFAPGVCTLEANDGYVTFGGGSQGIWEQLCLMMGRTDLYEGKDFTDLTEDKELSDKVDWLLVKWMEGKSRADIHREASSDWQLPVAPVLTISETIEDIQFIYQGSFQELDHPVAGRSVYPSPPSSINEKRLPLSRAPLLGEHNSEYL